MDTENQIARESELPISTMGGLKARGHPVGATGVYQMVLAEVEAPLLEEIMEYTRNNQTKASIMLGLNRGTLRKKLKQYGLLDSD